MKASLLSKTGVAVVAGAALGLFAGAWVGLAADVSISTNPIPKSVFVKDPAGRNPFEPKQSAGGGGNVPVPATNICDTIRITGVVGSGAGKMALVQGVPLRTGEKAEIKGTDGEKRWWEVKEIREDDVLLQTGTTLCLVVIQKRVLPSITGPDKGK